MDAAKAIRFQAFLEQLRRAEAASSFSEAYELLCQTLNEVEDRLTDIAYNPDNFQTDGRMYPPQEDTQRVVVGQQGVVRFRSRGHHTFISSNGSIEIQELSSQAATVVFTKTGADGRGVWE